ncbi:MAG: PIG-L family deacetylase [Gammaproteobacteria bacterium]|nr:PIG-L family deacetylase [Gammaproteobacteria bacterium]MDH3411284.1 PIG-L family deacetylase [Gammaproteobacteria bacterium]
MLTLSLDPRGTRALEVLCLGAHCDDIEIGSGAALMHLAAQRPLNVTWTILCSDATRARETRRSAQLFLRQARMKRVLIESFRDGFLPAQWANVKERIEALKQLPRPDLIFTHERDDRHQDHRIVCELTWNTFRDHLILEYEIAKFDGGLNQPNLYIPVGAKLAERKWRQLTRAYRSQAGNHWFTADAVRGMMAVRGIECRAPSGFAEAFHARKLTL